MRKSLFCHCITPIPMKRYFIPLLFFLATATAAAQNVMLKAGGGLAAQYGSAQSVGALKFGVGYEHEIDQHWTITPSLLFVAKGWQDPDRRVPVVNDETGQPEFDDEGNPVTSLMNRSVAANYIEVPVLFSYYVRLAPSRYLVLGAGPYAAFGVSGKVKVKGDGERIGAEKLYYDYSTFSSSGLRRFDAGLQAFVGYEFASGFNLGVEADFGLLRTSRDGGRNCSGMLALSYKF